MDARIPTALTAPLAALTARQTPAFQAPEAAAANAKGAGLTPIFRPVDRLLVHGVRLLIDSA